MAGLPIVRNGLRPVWAALDRLAAGGHTARLALCAAGLLALMAMLNPERFPTAQNFLSMAFQFPELGIFTLAVGITLITGGIDLSIIGAANLSAILAAMVLSEGSPLRGHWSSVPASIAVLLSAGALCGAFNGLLVSRAGVAPILATLGTMQLYTGAAMVLTKGRAVTGYPESILYIGNGSLLGAPVPLLLFLALLAALHVLLTHTRLGINLYLTGANPAAAWLSGTPVRAVLLKTYIASGVLAACAGLVIMARTNSAKADYGTSYLLQAVLAAVLAGIDPRGGAGRIGGVLLAVLCLQFLSSGLNMLMFHPVLGPYINNFAKEMTWGALLLGVMALNRVLDGRAGRRSA